MGILPVGFFSPLPLAMMIPFMATQSLAMGEAFGKSFQYGKRKISSMTNEEFNKLTFHDLMTEQTANIKAILPELSEQMAVSKEMQEAIFREMINLIPTFFESFKNSLPSDIIETSAQASPLPEIQQIRYTTDRNFQLQQDRIDDALKLFNDNFLKQRGTRESVASEAAAIASTAEVAAANKFRREQQVKSAAIAREQITQYNQLNLPPPSQKIQNQSSEWNIWKQKLTDIQSQWANHSLSLPRISGYGNEKARTAVLLAMKNLRIKMKTISNDYRNPNPMIQKGVIQLRQQLAAGQWG